MRLRHRGARALDFGTLPAWSYTTPAGTSDAALESMGMLVVLAVLAFIALAIALFVHAVRSPRGGRHGWIVVLPLVVGFGWIIEQLLVGR